MEFFRVSASASSSRAAWEKLLKQPVCLQKAGDEKVRQDYKELSGFSIMIRVWWYKES